MPNESKVDFERAAMLLGIVEKVAGVAPGMTHLSSAAMGEIQAINDAIKDEAVALSQARIAGEVTAPNRSLRASDVQDKPLDERKADPTTVGQEPATDPDNPERRL